MNRSGRALLVISLMVVGACGSATEPSTPIAGVAPPEPPFPGAPRLAVRRSRQVAAESGRVPRVRRSRRRGAIQAAASSAVTTPHPVPSRNFLTSAPGEAALVTTTPARARRRSTSNSRFRFLYAPTTSFRARASTWWCEARGVGDEKHIRLPMSRDTLSGSSTPSLPDQGRLHRGGHSTRATCHRSCTSRVRVVEHVVLPSDNP